VKQNAVVKTIVVNSFVRNRDAMYRDVLVQPKQREAFPTTKKEESPELGLAKGHLT
jgi:hypothetical protein